MRFTKSWVAAAAMVALTGAAQAELVSLGDGTVKDTKTNLIWLQDWNVTGLESWGTQKNWANNLNFAGSSDWALPSIGEYDALFAAYGDLTQVPKFTSVQSLDYWSGTEGSVGSDSSWAFSPDDGILSLRSQGNDGPPEALYAVAVRPGDVTASVPEPQTLALTLLALGATVVARRRRSR
jgi:hypothetical protein